MYQEGPRSFELDGVRVLEDSHDKKQWGYLATQVELGKTPDGSPAFSFIEYKPAAVAAGVKGGGYLSFRSQIVLPEATRQRILGRIAAMSPGGDVRLAPVPIEAGTVRCVALNLEGGGGTVATAPPPGAFNAVTTVLGAVSPSMVEPQDAVFSLVLNQEGTTILRKAFEQGATPVAAIYDLKYSVLTPDVHVEITADFDRIYTHFSAGIEAQIYWLRAGIDAGFEKLVQDGVIQIKVISFANADDREAKEKWALDFFKTDLLAKWFEPSLDLGQLKGPAQPEGLDGVLDRLKKLNPAGGTTTTQPPGGGTTPTTPAGGGGATPTPAPATPPRATLTTKETSPSPLPPGYGLSMTPAPSGTTETLVVQGPAGAAVTVDGKTKMLDAAGKVSVEVPAASSLPVTVDWPAAPPVEETFPLFFTFDQPRADGFSANPSNPIYGSYLRNSPTPADPRFSQSAAPGRTPPPGGAAALQEWLDRLATPKDVVVTAHASFEGESSAELTDRNQKLSERRLAVARGIIANRATIASAVARGFSRAREAGRIRVETDRVAEITGKVPGATPAVSIRATLARGAAPTPPKDGDPPKDGQPKDKDKDGQPKDGGGPATGGNQTPALVSFKLRFVRQEERKTLKVVYDRQQAVKRTVSPQGFLGMLLDELPDKRKHLVSVDLDDLFFRVLDVDVATPVDFQRIGLFASDVAIDYGDPANAQDHRHAEFRLTAADPGPKRFSTFLNAAHDIDFQTTVQHHFDANSGWIGEKLSYEIPARSQTDRTLKVDPADDLGFLELSIFPNRIDAGIVDAIDVDLSYDDGEGFQRNDVFRVLPDSEPQLWRLRLTHRDKRQWTARFTHHLKNGITRTSAPITSDASFLPVDDEFPATLDIRAIPLFGPDTVRRAFVDVGYRDLQNAYVRDERIEIPGDATEPVALRIALLDPTLRQFRHRVSLVTTDGRLIQNGPVDGEETLIGVGL